MSSSNNLQWPDHRQLVRHKSGVKISGPVVTSRAVPPPPQVSRALFEDSRDDGRDRARASQPTPPPRPKVKSDPRDTMRLGLSDILPLTEHVPHDGGATPDDAPTICADAMALDRNDLLQLVDGGVVELSHIELERHVGSQLGDLAPLIERQARGRRRPASESCRPTAQARHARRRPRAVGGGIARSVARNLAALGVALLAALEAGGRGLRWLTGLRLIHHTDLPHRRRMLPADRQSVAALGQRIQQLAGDDSALRRARVNLILDLDGTPRGIQLAANKTTSRR